MKTGWRRLVWTVAWLATATILFYAVENWRGARTWKRAEVRMQAAGMPPSWRAMVPPGVADEGNVAAAPVFAGLYRGEIVVENGRRAWKAAGPEFAERFKEELKPDDGIVAPKPAEGKLAVVPEGVAAPSGALLEEVRAALARPEAVWPIPYELGFGTVMAHLMPVRNAGKCFQQRALAALAAGDAAEAMREWRSLAAARRCLAGDLFLIPALVGQSLLGMEAAVAWEGLARRVWGLDELAEIERTLAPGQAALAVRRGFQGEAALLGESVLRMDGRELGVLVGLQDGSSPPRDWVLALWWAVRPRGWLDLDRARHADEMRSTVAGAAALEGGPIEPAMYTVEPAGKGPWLARMGRLIVMPLSELSLPSIRRCVGTTARAEAQLRQVAIACRLERARLAGGSYPGRLEEILPVDERQRLCDPVLGGPMVYRREGGGYMLYSIGWNGKDDGGVPGAGVDTGDWVWKMPPPGGSGAE